MSSRVSSPPDLVGFTPVRLIGSGGFADVFLYQQHRPRRNVAVKVLHTDSLDADALRRFDAEADLMALVSSHPAIVTVLQTDVAPDGRPFLVLEYCSKPNLSVRYRADRIEVSEVLRIGIRLASAVETAHRAGILHRDIKPANVLTTDHGWPALTDFGISVASTANHIASEAMSVPWSAPESFGDGVRVDERADVYALGATLYTLLARRSPFEQPSGANGTADMVGRILAGALPPLGRADVPVTLERALAATMATDPARRPLTALALAQSLQAVEAWMGLPTTGIEVLDAAAPVGTDVPQDDGRTRIRGILSIDPDLPSPRPPDGTTRVPRRPSRERDDPGAPSRPPADLLPLPPEPPVADTVHRPAGPTAAVPTAASVTRRPRWVLPAAVVAAVLVAAGVTGAVVLGGNGPDSGASDDVAPQGDGRPVVMERIPAPENLAGIAAAEGASFTWTNPEPQDGDLFLWRRVDPGAETDLAPVDATSVTVSGATGRVCIEVSLRRVSGQTSSEPATGCSG